MTIMLSPKKQSSKKKEGEKPKEAPAADVDESTQEASSQD